jgi:hypothetical protein
MDFSQQVNWFTIISGLITIVGAILTFILSQLGLHDKRKNFL